MQAILFIGYVALGLFQISPVMAGLEQWTDMNWFLAVPVSLIIAYIPGLGTGVAMYASVSAWQWSWLQASEGFLLPFVIILLLTILYLKMDSHRHSHHA